VANSVLNDGEGARAGERSTTPAENRRAVRTPLSDRRVSRTTTARHVGEASGWRSIRGRDPMSRRQPVVEAVAHLGDVIDESEAASSDRRGSHRGGAGADSDDGTRLSSALNVISGDTCWARSAKTVLMPPPRQRTSRGGRLRRHCCLTGVSRSWWADGVAVKCGGRSPGGGVAVAAGGHDV